MQWHLCLALMAKRGACQFPAAYLEGNFYLCVIQLGLNTRLVLQPGSAALPARTDSSWKSDCHARCAERVSKRGGGSYVDCSFFGYVRSCPVHGPE